MIVMVIIHCAQNKKTLGKDRFNKSLDFDLVTNSIGSACREQLPAVNLSRVVSLENWEWVDYGASLGR